MKRAKLPKLAKLAMACALVALSACSLAPSYQRPTVDQPASFQDSLIGWKLAEPGDAQPRGPWWKAFGDATLDALEERVSVSNQDLKAALAQWDQARAAAGVARSAFFPTLSASAYDNRERTSQNEPRFPAADTPYIDDASLGLSLNYELDLWGRVRNSVKTSAALAQASAGDVASLRLSLQAELASDYFALRGAQLSEQLLLKSVQADEQSLALTEHRYRGGLVTELDVDQARVQLENARTALADTRIKSAQLTHAIAVLVGQAAPGFTVAPAPLPKPLGKMATGLPSSLLERRPDVAAAERRVAAANANIGVARAAYFPTFSLDALFGFESAQQSTWFQAPSRFWSLGPQALVNVFDAGRIRGNVAIAQRAYDQTVASYRQTVLVAYQEVEDNLVAVHRLREELVSLSAAQQAAQRALQQAQLQYEGGLVTYLTVASAQTSQLEAEQARITVQVSELLAQIQLFKALGGGDFAPPMFKD